MHVNLIFFSIPAQLSIVINSNRDLAKADIKVYSVIAVTVNSIKAFLKVILASARRPAVEARSHMPSLCDFVRKFNDNATSTALKENVTSLTMLAMSASAR